MSDDIDVAYTHDTHRVDATFEWCARGTRHIRFKDHQG